MRPHRICDWKRQSSPLFVMAFAILASACGSKGQAPAGNPGARDDRLRQGAINACLDRATGFSEDGVPKSKSRSVAIFALASYKCSATVIDLESYARELIALRPDDQFRRLSEQE